MMMHDRAPIERIRRLPDGRLAAVAKFARSGCYTYAGHEVGKPHLSSVTVYRADDEVFAEDAMASFAHKAITLDHPSESVTAQNWRKVSVGYTEGRVARDGGFVEIPLMLADAEAVAAVDSGKARELSAGYTSELVWGDGIAPDGTPYQARQTKIRGDHIAIVPQGRAGSSCRLGDSAVQINDIQLTDAEREAALARAQTDALRAARYGGAVGAFDEAVVLNRARAVKAANAGMIGGEIARPGYVQTDAATATSTKAVRDAALAARYR